MDERAWIDRLVEHEAAYLSMISTAERGRHGIYLLSPQTPEYRDGNRALGLRTDGARADEVARDVIQYYKSRGLPAVADVDPIAEEQGIGEALMRSGMKPVLSDRLLMRLGDADLAPATSDTVIVEQIANDAGSGEASEWVETALADDLGWPDEAMWRKVAESEARSKACRLYLARIGSAAVGACDLFEEANWGRIESVVTIPTMRRRGVGTALVTRAVSDSLLHGNKITYLFTEPGGDAELLYRSVGFVTWSMNIFRQYRG